MHLLLYENAWVLAPLLAGVVYEQVARYRDRQSPHHGRMIMVNGCRLHVTDQGQGEPPVVVIGGAGESSYSWLRVRKEIAGLTRVITYDRPGLGMSDPGRRPDPDRTTRELHELLDQAGVVCPCILVGHALGGVVARLYAGRYPDRVAGMVLIDSAHEFMRRDLLFQVSFPLVLMALLGARILAPFGVPRLAGHLCGWLPLARRSRLCRRQLSPEEYRLWQGGVSRSLAGAALSEFGSAKRFLEAAWQQMAAVPGGAQFRDMPVVVLTRQAPETWAAVQRELAGRSTRGVHRVYHRKDYPVHMIRPELVVEAVRHVMAQVRERMAAAGA